ncbi:MAG: hypothetical protein HY973_04685 [Candidatus Kerfeldbacteria bacterium]|nr:hypothetical protein [Candidatus Kerfeldbacteria bacterium]
MLSLVVSFLVACLAVLVLSRFISRSLMELLGQRWYVWLLWPGVCLHEFSHLLGALITWTPVKGVSLWPKPSAGKKVELGSVTHEATANPFKLIVISFFPLVGGTLILWLGTRWLTTIEPTAVPSFSLIDGSLDSAVTYLDKWWNFMLVAGQSLNLGQWSGWLFLYMVLFSGAHLAPSNHDLVYTAAGVTIMGLVAVILSVIDWLANQNLIMKLANLAVSILQGLVPFLSYVLAWLFMVAVIVGVLALGKRLNQRATW